MPNKTFAFGTPMAGPLAKVAADCFEKMINSQRIGSQTVSNSPQHVEFILNVLTAMVRNYIHDVKKVDGERLGQHSKNSIRNNGIGINSIKKSME